MRFEIKHQFDYPLETVEKAMFDPNFFPFLLEKHGVLLEVEPQERNETESEIRRKVRYRPKPVIESIGPKKVPPEWFAFVEESTFNKKAHSVTFVNVPTTGKIRSMLMNKGSVSLREVAPGKTERVTQGELQLILPFLLKPLAAIGERVIHSEAVKLLDAEARVLREYISKQG